MDRLTDNRSTLCYVLDRLPYSKYITYHYMKLIYKRLYSDPWTTFVCSLKTIFFYKHLNLLAPYRVNSFQASINSYQTLFNNDMLSIFLIQNYSCYNRRKFVPVSVTGSRSNCAIILVPALFSSSVVFVFIPFWAVCHVSPQT